MNITAAQQKWDSLIRRKGDRGALRLNGVDRPISVSVQQESSMERLGVVSNPLDRIALISPLDPDTGQVIDPAPSEREVIVVPDRNGVETLFKMFAPPDSMGANIDPLYWRVKVRK
jgi:hypothetical protein